MGGGDAITTVEKQKKKSKTKKTVEKLMTYKKRIACSIKT